MQRPTLILQTTYFHRDDKEASFVLGRNLYERLTRPLADPLAFGAGIPVFSAVAPERMDMEAAEIVLAVPVLGKTAFATARPEVLEYWTRWHHARGNGLVFAVLTSENWRGVEDVMPAKPCLTELYGAGDRRRATLDEIVLAATRLLDPDSAQRTLFISHAKGDLARTEHAAERIQEYVNNYTTGRAFFDRTELLPGLSLSDQIEGAAGRGVFLSVRSDQYSSRVWCQRELLTAKRHGLPTLSVEVLKAGEPRSSPYGGNSPTLVWKKDPAAVASAAMVEWLRDAHFRREANRIRENAGLPPAVVMPRPPELLDLAQGPVVRGATQLVFHPDPELPVFERELLLSAHPRLHLATPTTVFRQLLGATGRRPVASPLEGLQIGMSLSKTPDERGPDGFTEEHVIDATLHLARTLISAGAAIAYGGDFRQQGYTVLLADLIPAYNQTATKRAEFLHSYLAAHLPDSDVPDRLQVTIHSMADCPDALVRRRKSRPHSLYLSDMRRVMAQKTQARIVMAGKTRPKTEAGAEGYSGRFPGIVEEAWRALKEGQPLYVVGGFGGAAALVADLLEGKPTPEALQDRTWWSSEFYRSNAGAIDADPSRRRLGLPGSLEDLADEVRRLGRRRLTSKKLGNGLTASENRLLFRTRDPVVIANLVMRGLLEVTRRRTKGRLETELVRGSIVKAAGLDCLAVPTFDDVPLGGAGLAIDQATGGMLSLAKEDGGRLVPLDTGDIGAEWVYLASLGPLKGFKESAEERVRRAAVETARMAKRHGLRRLGLVAFAGGVLADRPEAVVGAMAKGLKELSSDSSVSWFEEDPERFTTLLKLLKAEKKIKLTTRVTTLETAVRDSRESLTLATERSNRRLLTTVLPPSGTTLGGSWIDDLSDEDLKEFSSGFQADGLATPDLSTLTERGERLAKLLLGEEAKEVLAACAEAPVLIVHDMASALLPFETLTAPGGKPPATVGGLTRRLKLPGVSAKRLFARPQKSEWFEVLLVCNPTGNLPESMVECDAVKELLKGQQRVKLKILCESKATKAAFVEAVSGCDVLHYCGHGFYEGPGPAGSGLVLHNYEKLTLSDLERIELPRMAFVNACYAARLPSRSPSLQPGTEAMATFAQFFLANGIEAYLGTFWRVDDLAASEFARMVYLHLAEGGTLEQAVVLARGSLLQNGKRDWANYLLYGDGRFRLVRPA